MEGGRESRVEFVGMDPAAVHVSEGQKGGDGEARTSRES